MKLIREKRVSQLAEKIMTAIRTKGKQIAPYVEIVMALTEKESCAAKDVAAALMYLSEEQSSSPDMFTASESSSSEGSRDRNRDRGDRGDRVIVDAVIALSAEIVVIVDADLKVDQLVLVAIVLMININPAKIR